MILNLRQSLRCDCPIAVNGSGGKGIPPYGLMPPAFSYSSPPNGNNNKLLDIVFMQRALFQDPWGSRKGKWPHRNFLIPSMPSTFLMPFGNPNQACVSEIRTLAFFANRARPPPPLSIPAITDEIPAAVVPATTPGWISDFRDLAFLRKTLSPWDYISLRQEVLLFDSFGKSKTLYSIWFEPITFGIFPSFTKPNTKSSF